MRELSLFTGAGGGLLGTKLLGWTHIGYVEVNEYCQQVIAQRIEDGFLERAPIFTDVREFVQSGAAKQYRGIADVVSGGFPCQDISVAGGGAGIDGERSGLWSAMRDVIRDVRPRKVYMENSSAILVRGFERVANDLAEMGYSFRWGVLGAHHVGGIHKRERWWCAAADTSCRRLEGRYGISPERQASNGSIQALRENRIRLDIPEPGSFGDGHGMAYRVERTRAIGNGQVPIVAATAYRILSQ